MYTSRVKHLKKSSTVGYLSIKVLHLLSHKQASVEAQVPIEAFASHCNSTNHRRRAVPNAAGTTRQALRIIQLFSL